MPRSPAWIAFLGALGLAAGMGIGRFAFTPMLPLMQAEFGLALSAGGALASANYAGYLAGSLACFAASPEPGRAARTGLLWTALLTAGIALTSSFAAWMVLRFLAGVASALVLIGISSWALPRLAAAGGNGRSGWVFAGVGFGVMLAGLVGLVAGAAGIATGKAWIAMGVAAALVAALAWKPLGEAQATAARAPASGDALGFEGWRAVLCYGIYGFGYIIPATFLPAIARELVSDPARFGWTWPAFGFAAVASTLATGRALRRTAPAKLWAISMLVMAAGVLAPALAVNLWTIALAALCVGGTFVVITLVGVEHARVIAARSPAKLIAAMTAAFALGQLVGPLTIRGADAGAIVTPSLVAAALLVLAGAAIYPFGNSRRGVW